MQKRNDTQNKKLHLLLNKAGLLEDKPELVSFYTNGRTTSSRELYYNEAEKLISYLESITQNKAAKPKPVKVAASEKADKIRKNIIAICYELGWIEPSENPEERKINMAVIDRFLKNRGYLKKPLKDFTEKELPKLLTQFKQILEHSKTTAGSKATANLLAELNIPVQPSKRK